MIIRLLAVLVFLSVVDRVRGDEVPAADATWDHLPIVAYRDETVSLALRASLETTVAGWRVQSEATANTYMVEDGRVLRVSLRPGAAPWVRVVDASGPLATVEFVSPGKAHGIAFAPAGHLHRGGARVVLVVDRKEATADRRWALLRGERPEDLRPCAVVLPVPGNSDADVPTQAEAVGVPWGRAPLVAQVAAAQDLLPAGKGVLIQLGSAAIHAAWKHRSYRQVLAWLVEDLRFRGATRIVFVQAPVSTQDRAAAEPLWRQVRDIATTYDCDLIETAALLDRRYWEVAPGVGGDHLNPDGMAAYTALCQDHLSDDARLQVP